MRTDPVERRTTHESGRKKDARDLDRHGPPLSPAHRPEAQAEDDTSAADRLRSRDPDFDRGHH